VSPFDKLLLGKYLRQAIDRGHFANVMKTNSRMFFRGVLPILTSGHLHLEPNCNSAAASENRILERLIAVGSFGPIMDYAVRYYVMQNTVGTLDGGIGDGLLKHAFLYHLIEAIRSAGKEGMNEVAMEIKEKELHAAEQLQSELPTYSQEDPLEKVFEVGLATRFSTSRALKYLACFGYTCQLRPEFGDEFEELTALHCLRLWEVQGYTGKRVILCYAWPPRSNKKDILTNDIQKLKDDLKLQVTDELQELLFPVFSQGRPTAQGGDILVLIAEEGKYVLEAIQCKHYKKSPGGTVMASWWQSLGIEYDNNPKESNASPTEGKAGYSYAGLMAFCNLLQSKVKNPDHRVELGRRILALSFPMPPKASISVPALDCATVWFREMLEPTISTFSLQEGSDDHD